MASLAFELKIKTARVYKEERNYLIINHILFFDDSFVLSLVSHDGHSFDFDDDIKMLY